MGRGRGQKRERNLIGHPSVGKSEEGEEDEWRGVMQSVHFLIWGGKRMEEEEEEEEATPTTAQSRR